MQKITPIILTVLVFILVGAMYSYVSKNKPVQKACTLEAKICPDGSSVGRTGPNCDFAACPSQSPTSSKSGIRGHVLLGPTCPVEKIPPDPNCADKPYKTNLVLTSADQSYVIAQFSSDENGKFSIETDPGEYQIRSAAAANILPYCSSSGTIKVTAHTYTSAAISCDTGIR